MELSSRLVSACASLAVRFQDIVPSIQLGEVVGCDAVSSFQEEEVGSRKNAPMTPAGRVRMVQAVLLGSPIGSVCQTKSDRPQVGTQDAALAGTTSWRWTAPRAYPQDGRRRWEARRRGFPRARSRLLSASRLRGSARNDGKHQDLSLEDLREQVSSLAYQAPVHLTFSFTAGAVWDAQKRPD